MLDKRSVWNYIGQLRFFIGSSEEVSVICCLVQREEIAVKVARQCALILFVVALVGLQAACTMFYKRPDMELEAASAGISDSKQACGDIYATDTFQDAQRTLNEARVAADNKEKGAKDLALEAKSLAEESKTDAIKRGADARAVAEKNLSATGDLLSEVEGVLSDLGEDEGTAPFLNRLSSLRELRSEVESQLGGSRCDLLLAEAGSKTLLADAKELAADVENYSTSAAAVEASVLHSVVKGECLWRIAGYPTAYSDPFLWPLIYSANRDQIKDPDLIFPGQVFEILMDATDADLDQARYKARTRGAWSLYDGR